MSTLVLATGNRGKQREFAELLAGSPWTLRLQSEFDVGPVAETGLTFVENALIKARHAAEITGLPTVADDSGIVCDALDGAPGIRSARYSGPDASDEENLQRLLAAMAGVREDQRGCRYVCVLVYLRHAADPCPIIAEGIWQGRLTRAPVGKGGFGYDPIFWVPGESCSAAQLPPVRKNVLSHRGQALRALAAKLNAGG